MPDTGQPTGAQATPDMVDALTQTEEVVMTKDGPRPLTPEEQAGNSPAASTTGAPTETAAPGTEGTPAPAPTSTPAPAAPSVPTPAPNTMATANPSTALVIDAAGQPVPTSPEDQTAAPTVASPAPAETATPTARATPGLDQLGAFVQETNAKAAATVEDARRVAQGQADRQTALLNKQLEAANLATQEVRTQMHELSVRDLSPEDRAKAVTAFEQQDERQELDRIREELTVTHRGVFVDSLVLEYSPYGITRESIESTSDVPEAMELYCEQQKSAFLQAKLDEPATAPITQVPAAPAAVTVAPTATVVAPSQVVSAPAATPIPTPVAAAPAQPVPVAAANAPGAAAAAVPAGAESPSDIGATGAATEAWKPSEEAGSEAMKSNIKHMAWEPVQLPR